MDNLFEQFNSLGWFKEEKYIDKIKALFDNFPEKKFLNLSVFQFDAFEFNECSDYQYLINRFGNFSNLEFKVECIKKNKIELIYNGKKYKKSFRINGSRFDTDSLIDFLNNKVLKNSTKKFFMLDSPSHLEYPIWADPQLVEKAKELSLIGTR